MIINGKAIAEEVLQKLQEERPKLPSVLRLGVLMSEGDKATESFVRIKEHVADRLQVVIVKDLLKPDATTAQALRAVEHLAKTAQGVIVQLPLPKQIDTNAVLAAIPKAKDVDFVRPPIAQAIEEILRQEHIDVRNKKAVVIGEGRLVGTPAAKLLKNLGAEVHVVSLERGSLKELKTADIVVSGAGSPGLIKPEMLKSGVVLIDAGTSAPSSSDKLVTAFTGIPPKAVMGDADPACAGVASIFTPVPGGIGPIAVAMLFKNLFALAR